LFQFIVQDLGPRLQQQMGTTQGPLHRLLLDQALADDLINGGLDKSCADCLPVPVALAEIRNELAAIANVSLKLRQTVGQFRRGALNAPGSG